MDRVLLISGSEPGKRFAVHKNVIDAAVAAGSARFVYTSVSKATSFDWPLGAEHKQTEEALAASGLPTVILRNDWYTENYIGDVQRAAESGVIAASVGDGRVAPASRQDYAEAAAAVLTEDGHIGAGLRARRRCEHHLRRPRGRRRRGTRARCRVRAADARGEYVAGLQSAGLDAGTAEFVASMDDGIRGGVLADTDGTLARLIGRPTTPVVDGLRAALAHGVCTPA